jgi:hypothetical protein
MNTYEMKRNLFHKARTDSVKTVRLVTDNNETGRMAILINLRRDKTIDRFKKRSATLPTSIIDFAIIPLKKPFLDRKEK